MKPTRTELKITIAKLLEVAYSKNKDVTAKLVRSKGPFKLTVDAEGNARLSGQLGAVSFSGTPILDAIGANIKSINVNFSHGEGNIVNYKASIDLKVAKMAILGEFDVEELILSCSGILCQVVRIMNGRKHAYDLKLKEIMGQ